MEKIEIEFSKKGWEKDMNNFTFYAPTYFVFGKETENETGNNNPKYLHILFEHIKIWFLCFVPILNLLMLISLLVNGINVKEY